MNYYVKHYVVLLKNSAVIISKHALTLVQLKQSNDAINRSEKVIVFFKMLAFPPTINFLVKYFWCCFNQFFCNTLDKN